MQTQPALPKFKKISVSTVKDAYSLMRQGYWILAGTGWHWYILCGGVIHVETPFSSYGCGIRTLRESLEYHKTLIAARRADGE